LALALLDPAAGNRQRRLRLREPGGRFGVTLLGVVERPRGALEPLVVAAGMRGIRRRGRMLAAAAHRAGIALDEARGERGGARGAPGAEDPFVGEPRGGQPGRGPL